MAAEEGGALLSTTHSEVGGAANCHATSQLNCARSTSGTAAVQRVERVTAIQSKYKMIGAWPLTKNRLEAGMSLITRCSFSPALFVAGKFPVCDCQAHLALLHVEVYPRGVLVLDTAHRDPRAVGAGIPLCSCSPYCSVGCAFADLQGNSIPR